MYVVHEIEISPSSGHPSTAGEASYWLKHVCAVGAFAYHRPAFFREMWFTDCLCICVNSMSIDFGS